MVRGVMMAIRALVSLMALAGCGAARSPEVSSATKASGAGLIVWSASFVSPEVGWALGESPCSTGRCLALFKTSNAGSTWVRRTLPPFTSSPWFLTATIDFATPEDGWAYDSNESQPSGATGDQLFATHDGGRSWVSIRPRNLDKFGMSLEALAATKSHVWAVLFSRSTDDFVIAGSPVDENDWATVPLTLPLGAGPVTNFQIVLSGRNGWIIDNDRGVVGGAKLKAGRWSAWSPPCTRNYGDGKLASYAPDEVLVYCSQGEYVQSPLPAALFVSDRAGLTFRRLSASPPKNGEAVSSPMPGVIMFEAMEPVGAAIAGSFDNGKTWRTLAAFALFNRTNWSNWGPITFVSNTEGWAVTPAGSLLRTSNGGHTWSPTRFG